MSDHKLKQQGVGPSELPNPLLEPLGPYMSAAEWPARLAHDPFALVDRGRLTEEQRETLLSNVHDCFEPTSKSIEIAASCQRMIRSGYARRNPTVPANRLQQNQILSLRGEATSGCAWQSSFADAMMVSGIAGTGKSHTIQRICSLIPQSHLHTASVVAGWTRQLQVLYLIIPMPASRGGLLYGILEALGRAVGTEFMVRYAAGRSWTIEKLTIHVGTLLAQYFVGLLIIEELQPRNFSASPYRDEMLLMLLRLLNFGIPVLLVGNPLGFVGILEHSQDARRLTSQEPVELMPLEADDDDWTEGVAPALWTQTVLPDRSPFDSAISRELWECSAGIPDFAQKAMVGAQRIALRSGAHRLSVEHLHRYRTDSSSFAIFKDMIEGFSQKDPLKLSKYLDIPWEAYGQRWGKLDSAVQVNSSRARVARISVMPMDPKERDAYLNVHQRLQGNHRNHPPGKLAAGIDRPSRTTTGTGDSRTEPRNVLSESLAELQAKIRQHKE